ncbi:MAG: class I SAM-dependent methyltransferase [Pseudomonadota bacterium]
MWDRLASLFRGPRRESVDLGARFTEVYEQRLWLSEESVSGSGSERQSGQVRHSIDLLNRFTRELQIRSIADIPCGDFNWMPEYLDQNPGVEYVGYDVVPALIAENRAKFPGRRLEVLDITRRRPARADLVFSKDMFNHLPLDDIWAALENMVASRPRYLLLTTNKGFENIELEPTQPHASRHLDLQAAPFLLPEPLYGDHYLLLWRREDVERRLAARKAA